MQTQNAPISVHSDMSGTPDTSDAELANAERGLKGAAIFMMLTGLLFSGGAVAFSDFGVRFLLDLVFFRIGEGPEALEESHRLVNAILGGAMVGWGAMIWLTCHLDDDLASTYRSAFSLETYD